MTIFENAKTLTIKNKDVKSITTREGGVIWQKEQEGSINIVSPNITMHFHNGTRFAPIITFNEDDVSFNSPDINPNSFEDIIDNYLEYNGIYLKVNGPIYKRGYPNSGIPLNIDSGEYIGQVLVVYNGEYKIASNTITILPTIKCSQSFEKYLGDNDVLYITFLDVNGDPIINTEMEYNLIGQFYSETTDSNGQILLDFNTFEAGNHIATFLNLVTGERKSVELNLLNRFELIASDIDKYFRCEPQLYMRLYDKGELVITHETINFVINGVSYNRVISEVNGDYYIKLNINLEPGEYTIIANYTYDGITYSTSNNCIVRHRLYASDLVMNYGDGSTFNVILLNCNGIPISGETIAFDINGIIYNKVTNDGGIAKLPINMMPGEYIITSSYNGEVISNTIKVSG